MTRRSKWDRDLVRHLFGFDYVWEVYKPAAQRKWGWYVCPLLYRGELVGRVDARVERNALIVKKLWIEGDVPFEAITTALERHAVACGVTKVRMPRTGFPSPHRSGEKVPRRGG